MAHRINRRRRRDSQEDFNRMMDRRVGNIGDDPLPDLGDLLPWRKRYRPTDHAKRHRLRDDQPKTQRVRAYTRRT